MEVGVGERRWARWTGVGGLAFAAAGFVTYVFLPRRPLPTSILEGLALVCFTVYVAMNFRLLRVASTGRAARVGLHSGLLSVTFIAVIGLANVLAVRHNTQWDLSGSGQFSLSPQTVKILKALDRDVTVTLFVQDLGPTKETLHSLVGSYQQYTPRLTAVFVDPDKRPAVARQYGVTQYDTVVFESGGQVTRVRLLGQEDLNNREQLFTNALIRVTRTEKKRIAFLEGHGEHRLDDSGQGGFSAVKEGLEREGYEVVGVSLAQSGSVPDKTTVLVMGGGVKLMAPQEMEAIRAYLNKGGRVLVLTDPEVTTGLEPLLADWGVVPERDLAIETSISLFGAGLDVVVARSYSAEHPVTKDFALNTAFPAARSLRFDPAKSAQFKHDDLVMTSDKSWGETDLKNQQVSYDRLRDIKGPLTLAMAVQPVPPKKDQAPADASAPSSAARLVVFGDSDFATNSYFRLYGNGDLLLNVINWLAEDQAVISIRPKEARMSPLILNTEQAAVVFWVSVAILPGVALLGGVGAWQWRRRL
ncbi:MAG TPA: DUF4350 domain-containing protein [Nitrospiria bacterium]|nr:DUF4350 domain-containing protein [Nitrospiria bacterium]